MSPIVRQFGNQRKHHSIREKPQAWSPDNGLTESSGTEINYSPKRIFSILRAKRGESDNSKLSIILPSVIVPCIIVISLLLIYFLYWRPRRRRQQGNQGEEGLQTTFKENKPTYQKKYENNTINSKKYKEGTVIHDKDTTRSLGSRNSYGRDLDLYNVPRLTLRLSHSEFLPWNDLFARSAEGHGVLADNNIEINLRSSSLKRKNSLKLNQDGLTKKEYKNSNLNGKTERKEKKINLKRENTLDRIKHFHQKSKQSKSLINDMVKDILDLLPYNSDTNRDSSKTESQAFETEVDSIDWDTSYYLHQSIISDYNKETTEDTYSEMVSYEGELPNDAKYMTTKKPLLPDPFLSSIKPETKLKSLPLTPPDMRDQNVELLEDLPMPPNRSKLSTYGLDIIMESPLSSVRFSHTNDNMSHTDSELESVMTEGEPQRLSVFDSLFDSPNEKKLPRIPLPPNMENPLPVPPSWGELSNHSIVSDPTSFLFVVSYSYVPKLADEILIAKGEIVSILKEYDDGWCLVRLVLKSTSQGDLIESSVEEQGMCPKGCLVPL